MQLEFNLDNLTDEDHRLSMMQRQIDEAVTSMDKVRRRLFSEITEVKRICADLQAENAELKSKLQEIYDEERSPFFDGEKLQAVGY